MLLTEDEGEMKNMLERMKVHLDRKRLEGNVEKILKFRNGRADEEIELEMERKKN